MCDARYLHNTLHMKTKVGICYEYALHTTIAIENTAYDDVFNLILVLINEFTQMKHVTRTRVVNVTKQYDLGKLHKWIAHRMEVRFILPESKTLDIFRYFFG